MNWLQFDICMHAYATDSMIASLIASFRLRIGYYVALGYVSKHFKAPGGALAQDRMAETMD